MTEMGTKKYKYDVLFYFTDILRIRAKKNTLYCFFYRSGISLIVVQINVIGFAAPSPLTKIQLIQFFQLSL